MTFDQLHEGIENVCNCLENNGEVSENTSDTFARRVKNKPPELSDFASYYQEKQPCRKTDCKTVCQHRTVSANKIDEHNEEVLKLKWLEFLRFKPKASKIFCKFKLKENAGLVWHTPNGKQPCHYSILKSDEFTMEHLELIDVFELV